MKTVLFTLILLLFYDVSYGQQAILITKNRSNYYEEYSVLKSDKKIRHGSYFKLSKLLVGGYAIESSGNYSNGTKDGYWETYYENTNNIRDKGFYKNGAKDSTWVSFYPEGVLRRLSEVQSNQGTSIQIVDAKPITSKIGNYKDGKLAGIWDYFDLSGVVCQKYDYDKDSLIFLQNNDLKNIDAGFIGGEHLLEQHLYSIFNFNELLSAVNSKVSLQPGKIAFRFTIDEKGKVSSITELENTINNKKVFDRAIETAQSLDSKWYPKRENGIPQHTTKIINFELAVSSTLNSSSTEQWVFLNRAKEFKLDIKVE